MAPNIRVALAEIRRNSDTNYTVVVTAERGEVKASFEVTVLTRQRKGWHGALKHHTEVEMLEREAREEVLKFCERMTAPI